MLNLRSFTRRYAYPLWPWYLGGLAFLAITNMITLEIPQLAKTVVNSLSSPTDPEGMKWIALSIVGLGVLQILVRSLSRILIFWPGRKLEATSKTDFFAKAMTFPQEFFARHGMGDLISRLANDVGHLRVFYAFGVLQLFNLVFLFGFTVTKMASVHLRLTLVCLVPILLMLVVMRFVMPKMHKYSRQNQEALGRLTNKVTESFINVHVIQSNAAQGAFLERAEKENHEVYDTNMKLIAVRTFFFPLMTTLTGVSQLLVLFYGGSEIMQGRLSVGDILAFNIYLSYLAFPLTSIGIILGVYKRTQTALERLDLFEQENPEPLAGTSKQTSLLPDTNHLPLLSIKKLNFAYPKETTEGGGRRDALINLNLSLMPGEKLGVFGPVGSGKSTLFRLITRLYTPPRGTVFFYGVDVCDLDPHWLRKRVGLALQSVHLFSDSVEENLKFGIDREVSPSELRQATDAAVMTQEIAGFEEGLQTKVGEKGIRLSGGQKHRLALARLFLRHYDLLLLDDVLAAVDNQTEAKLIDHILARPSAAIIASHRIPALKACDRVLYLKDGATVDLGTYEELASRHPELKDETHAREYE